MAENVLEVRNLKRYFQVERGFPGKGGTFLKAVDGVSFTIDEGETIGLVGESGCGKTTLGRTVLRLQDATEGEIIYRGKHIENLPARQLRELRKDMQLIFQDPFAALNPRMTIFKAVRAPLDAFSTGTEKERNEAARKILERVGLDEAQIQKYPHEMSGGQRQRAVIARALVLKPDFIVADEPVSALDVSVRAQILNLMKSLQEFMNLTSLFISHDMSVIRFMCNRIMVMYLGKIVEVVTNEELFSHPVHPYTKALVAAIPIPEVTEKKKNIYRLEGDVPNPADIPKGCRFQNRCPHVCERCRQEEPVLQDIGDRHLVACHLANELA